MNPLSDGLPSRADWTQNTNIVFLVGCPRSGTTWLQALLASHPDIYTGPETSFFAAFAQSEKVFLRKKDRPVDLAAYWTKATYYDTIVDLFWRLVSHLPEPQAVPKYFLEKTPQHSLHAEFILRALPHARFIHLVRDSRAVVASYLRAARGWGQDWAPTTATVGAFEWRRHIVASRSIAQLVESRDQYFELRYEDVRLQPHHYLTKLYDWLNLRQDESLIETAVEANRIDRLRNATQPFESIPLIDRREADRRTGIAYPPGFIGPAPQQPEDFQLTRFQRLKVEQLTGDLLRELGYAHVRERFSIWEKLVTSWRIRSRLRLPAI